jgi:hypothetical protein
MSCLPYELKLKLFDHIIDLQSLEKLLLSFEGFYEVFDQYKYKIISNIICRKKNTYANYFVQAAAIGYIDMIKYLIITYGCQNVYEEALNYSIRNKHNDITTYILDVIPESSHVSTKALELGVEHDNVEIVKYARKKGASVSSTAILYSMASSKEVYDYFENYVLDFDF